MKLIFARQKVLHKYLHSTLRGFYDPPFEPHILLPWPFRRMQIANCSWKSHIRDDATKSKVAHLQQIAAHCLGHVVVFSLFLWRCEMTHSGQVSRNLPRHSVSLVRASAKRKVQLQLCTVNYELWPVVKPCPICQSCQLRCHSANSTAPSSSSTARYQTIFIHKSQSHSCVNSLGTAAGLDLWGLSINPYRNIQNICKFLAKIFVHCFDFLRYHFLCEIFSKRISNFPKIYATGWGFWYLLV